jgi:Rho GTPase-activating protein 1
VSLESVSTDPLSAKDPPKMSPRFLDRKGSVPVMVEQRALHQSMPVPKSTNMAAEDSKPAAPQAHAKTPSILPKNSKQVRDYDYYLNMAKSMDFTEFQQYRMLYQAGVDFSNRPIIVLIGSRVPAKKISLDMFILYTLSTMDPIVEKEYSIVYVHSGMTSENKLSFSWLRKVSSMFTRKYKKNLKQLFIIQPTFFVKTVFGLFRPFISSKFWKKLVYIDDIKQQLSKYMNIQQLMLPDDVLQSTLKRSGAKADEHQIFGVKLEEVMLHPLNKDKKVPFIVEKALLYVEQHGLQTEGIFRLSGNSNKIQEMKKLIDKGQDVKFSDEFEAHAIAGLLKLYFRELPDPLFTFALYNDIVACHAEGDDDKCLELLRGVLAKLPEVNRLTLKRLMYTLEIIAGSAVTKMTPVNLSIVFAPNLLRCLNETPEIALRDTPAVNRLMKLMIINHSVLLP